MQLRLPGFVKQLGTLKRQTFLKFAFLSSLLFLCLIYENCDKSNTLVPLTTVIQQTIQQQSVQVNFCTPPPVNQNLNLKTVIIFDHSGSNQLNYQMAPDGGPSNPVTVSASLATDPNGILRYGTQTTPGSVLNYLANLPANNPANPSKFFALVDFADDTQSYPAGNTGFTSDIPGFYNYMLQDATSNNGKPTDGGSTNYDAALQAAYTIINNDIQSQIKCSALPTNTTPTANCPTPGVQLASSYVIIFMSDGSPIIKSGIVQNSNGSFSNNPLSADQCQLPLVLLDQTLCKDSTTTILTDVQNIAQLASYQQYVASINLFTVYYYVPGNIDTTAQTLLQQMAKVGNGVNYNIGKGNTVPYSNFQPPQKQLQYTLSDVLVTNTSGVWWTDGKYYLDTDHDGLPDFIEQQWGSDPNNAMTAGDGISDLVRYNMTNAAACQSMGANGICTALPTIPNVNTVCSGIKTTADPNHPGAILYHSSDPNGMNDCEKSLLQDSAGVNNPDSNGDSIPDWLEYRNGVPFQAKTTPVVSSPQSDGYSIYDKIKYSLPVQTAVNNLPNVVPSNYTINQTSSTPSKTCYAMIVTNMPVASNHDQIRVDVSFKTNLVNVPGQYKMGLKSFSPGNNTLMFNDWNDPTEISNNTWSQWP